MSLIGFQWLHGSLVIGFMVGAILRFCYKTGKYQILNMSVAPEISSDWNLSAVCALTPAHQPVC